MFGVSDDGRGGVKEYEGGSFVFAISFSHRWEVWRERKDQG